ncbi:ABC transporter substrate-binding protein [Intrasporangium calvum]|uniref:ABC transporter substrate-binding protein n=1 Tax=Intrasporangium calvum TaxID=53358 RepID=A0ABT5GE39_9MICO|nr:ABC transporter substrate-binding protein [Intrasporangium calvum]MDC5696523.1 ABC transporter substrate-binding protein [Intrasporangium calvum]
MTSSNQRGTPVKNQVRRSVVPRRAIITAAAAAALTFGVAGCGADSEGPGTGATGGGNSEPYRVGVLVGLTGSYAALGEPERQAVELYFKEVNAKGGLNGRPIELVVVDSGSNEGTAVNQYRKLAIEENVHAIIGPSSSGESIALRTFSNQLKVPTIALASSSSIVTPAEEAGYIFKQYTGTNESLKAQIQFAKEQGWTKVGLLHTNDGYGQDPAKRIDAVASEFGIQVTGKEAFDATTTDVTAQLGKLAGGSPDVVLVWAVNPANAVVAKSAESIGFKPVLFNSPGAGSPAYIENSGAAADGTYLQGSVVLAPTSLKQDNPQYEATNRIVEAFKAANAGAPGQFAANGWDGSILLENAITKASSHDPQDVQATRDALRASLEANTKDVVGVNSIYTFTPEFHGSLSLGGLAVLKVESGAFKVEQSY